MKNTLLDQAAKDSILARIDRLEPTAQALWGRMSVAQMVCHCGDQFKMASGEIPVEGKAPIGGRTIAKWLVMRGLPTAKGQIPTYPAIDQVADGGTKPTLFAADTKALKLQIETFIARGDGFSWQMHPFFGKLKHRQWAKLAYGHLDHHLSQFGA